VTFCCHFFVTYLSATRC